MNRPVLVRLIERQRALQNGLDPGQLRNGRPILARGLQIAEPADRVRIKRIESLGLDAGELGHELVVIDALPVAGGRIREADRPFTVTASLCGELHRLIAFGKTRSVERKDLCACVEETDVIGMLRDQAIYEQQIGGHAALDEIRIVLVENRRRQRAGRDRA